MKLISLVRHGQASFGEENYDKLSSKGIVQTQWLGDSFRQSGRQVHYLTAGTMKRQYDSMMNFLSHYYVNREGIELHEFNHEVESIATPSVTLPILLSQDAGFDEFNHEQVLFNANLGFQDKASFMAFLTAQKKPELTFTSLFATAMQRWQGGQFNDEYDESWTEFLQRTWQAFEWVIAATGEHEHAMVFTSGGVIASIIQQILHLTDQQAFDLNWHTANASVHQLRVTDSGIYLQSFNEFSYLYQQGEQMVTWR